MSIQVLPRHPISPPINNMSYLPPSFLQLQADKTVMTAPGTDISLPALEFGITLLQKGRHAFLEVLRAEAEPLHVALEL